jgi:hypothetical protein
MIGMDSKPLGQYWRRGGEDCNLDTAAVLFSGKEFSRILCNPKFCCCVGFEVLRVMSKDILYSRIFPHFMQSEILFLCRI